MSQTIPAIFDSGVFRPLEPVELAEGPAVEVHLPRPEDASAGLSPDGLARPQAAIARFLDTMEALPNEGPDDGFSGRDHDKVLYGDP